MYRSNGPAYALISSGFDRKVESELMTNDAIDDYVEGLDLKWDECEGENGVFDMVGTQGTYYFYCPLEVDRTD